MIYLRTGESVVGVNTKRESAQKQLPFSFLFIKKSTFHAQTRA